MKLSELEAKIEAILFTMGEAVELERIAAATEQDEDTCRKVIRSMMDNYAAEYSDHRTGWCVSDVYESRYV